VAESPSPDTEAFVLNKRGADETVWIGSKVLLDSRDIKKAAVVQFVEIPPLLQLDLTDVGGKKWLEMARQLNGKRFAIFFNGELYSVVAIRGDSLSKGLSLPTSLGEID
jgi:preprotein translocase subunit SecD